MFLPNAFKMTAIAVAVSVSTTAFAQEIELSGLEIGGVLEVELGYSGGGNESVSDITVATVEFDLTAEISEQVSAEVILLHEEGDTDFSVDGATLNFNFGSRSVTLGHLVVPFGMFETNLVNDTLALELGETAETAVIVVGMETGAVSGSVYLFNGEQDEGDHDTLTNFGFSVAYGNDDYVVGVDYLSNIADSDTLQEIADLGESAPAGMSLHGAASFGSITVVAEFMTALNDFDGADVDGNVLIGITPSAMHIELAYNVGRWTYATAYQMTDEAIFFPESRLSIGGSTEISKSTGLAIELWNDEDYAGENATSLVAQVSAIF